MYGSKHSEQTGYEVSSVYYVRDLRFAKILSAPLSAAAMTPNCGFTVKGDTMLASMTWMF